MAFTNPMTQRLSPLERMNLIQLKQHLRQERYYRLKRIQHNLSMKERKNQQNLIDKICEHVEATSQKYRKLNQDSKRKLLTAGPSSSVNENNKQLVLSSDKNKQMVLPGDSKKRKFGLFSADFSYDDILAEENNKITSKEFEKDNSILHITKNNNNGHALSEGTSKSINKHPSNNSFMKVNPSSGFRFTKKNLSLLKPSEVDIAESTRAEETIVNTQDTPSKIVTGTQPSMFGSSIPIKQGNTTLSEPAASSSPSLAQEKPKPSTGFTLGSIKKAETEDQSNKSFSIGSNPLSSTGTSHSLFSSISKAGAEKEAASKAPVSSFKFGNSSNVIADKPVGNELEGTKSSNGGFLFGKNSSKPATSNGLNFSFGTNSSKSDTKALKEPTIAKTDVIKENESEAKENSSDDNKTTASFSFGKSNSSEKPFQFNKSAAGSFGKPVTDNKVKSEKTSLFSFGKSVDDKKVENTKTPAFSFSKPVGDNKVEEEAPVFSLGNSKTTLAEKSTGQSSNVGFNFGSSLGGENNSTKPKLTFGDISTKSSSAAEEKEKPATASSGFSFANNNKDTSAPFSFDKALPTDTKASSNPTSTFAFGGQSKETKLGPQISTAAVSESGSSIFGNDLNKISDSKPTTGGFGLKKSSEASGATSIFSFGKTQPSADSTQAKKSPLFGNVSTTDSTKPFTFGGSNPTNSSTSAASPSPGFNFGSAKTSSASGSATAFNFGATNTKIVGATTPNFGFGKNMNADEAPKKSTLNSSFGNQMSDNNNLFGEKRSFETNDEPDMKKKGAFGSSFGNNSNSLATPKPAQPIFGGASGSTSFNFSGSSSKTPMNGGSKFNFGNVDGQQSQPRSSTPFGTTQASGVNNSNNNQISSNPGSSGFNFGNNSNSNNNNNNNSNSSGAFGNKIADGNGFSFGGASNSSSNANNAFGNNGFGNNSQSNSGGFNFGAQNNGSAFGSMNNSGSPFGNTSNNGGAFSGNNNSQNNNNNNSNQGGGNGGFNFSFGAGNNSALPDPTSVFGNPGTPNPPQMNAGNTSNGFNFAQGSTPPVTPGTTGTPRRILHPRGRLRR
ncbi:hypothetical protein DASC09_058910 [Saccharomycopsis crataegensis]|uniref:Uncharacterized protein n=1 Tax=Saccharomycopsis crataegensis TaxID=43959 RepID=A0AAV5QVF6_9ASCO|nr:hypothetical protein DASC09_058910 [Saccharomycopsis crataegensis]